MKRIGHRAVLIPLFLVCCLVLSGAETFKVVTYNILNFPDALGLQRIKYLRRVLEYIEPDILVVQEMETEDGVELFLDSILNYSSAQFDAVPFHDGPDTDNALFYRKADIECADAEYLATPNRDIAAYQMRIKNSDIEFYILSVHFKSSQGTTNELIRLQEATVLRSHLDSLPENTDFLILGDFNIYRSGEAAFEKLTGGSGEEHGCSFDPLNAWGDWHENVDFSYLHTQSTRLVELEDGGAGGGIDDRFDMILCSRGLLDMSGLYLLPESYTIYGNDADHFNKAVNSGFNQSVPEDIAEGLYYASDHLPVAVNITDVFEQTPKKEEVKIWPNPMEQEAQIKFPKHDDFKSATLILTNILGQRVHSSTVYNPLGTVLKRARLPVGVYFLHLTIKTKFNEYNYQTKLAVVE
ncbi:MAG TPA: hypothetical protein ENI52_01185 [Thermoplasmata archaeon]|nr:hypothetical protein [Thermoplasmata archaeon]